MRDILQFLSRDTQTQIIARCAIPMILYWLPFNYTAHHQINHIYMILPLLCAPTHNYANMRILRKIGSYPHLWGARCAPIIEDLRFPIKNTLSYWIFWKWLSIKSSCLVRNFPSSCSWVFWPRSLKGDSQSCSAKWPQLAVQYFPVCAPTH